MSFIKELKRRNVIRVAIAYAVATWLLIEVSATTFPMLRLPEWTATFVAVLLMIGFPVALIFAWAFELTPDGLKREHEVDRSESITRQTGQKINRTIIAVLIAAVGFLLIDKFYLRQIPTETAVVDKSVAVLPFVSLSNGPDDEYFADGLTEEILTSLTRVPDLLVTARTSAFHFKGKNTPITEIAKSLGVAHVVEGSVRRNGDQLRVTAQLIRAADGFYLWSNSYDRETRDTFSVQTHIAERIAEALDVVLDAEQIGRMGRFGIRDPDVYVSYQKAFELYNEAHEHKTRLDLLRQAHDEVEKVITEAPALVYAHYIYADYYTHVISYGADEDGTPISDAYLSQALEAIDASYRNISAAAVNDKQRLSAAHDLRLISGDWEGLPALVEQIANEPDCSEITWTDTVTVPYGFAETAARIEESALWCDPLQPSNWFARIRTLNWLRDYEAAIAIGEKALALGMEAYVVHEMILANLALGRVSGAQSLVDTSTVDENRRLYQRLTIAASSGDRVAAYDLLEQFLRMEEDRIISGVVLARAGKREDVNRIAAQFDAEPFGYLTLMQIPSLCECGPPWELEVTPNFERLLDDAGLPWPPDSPINWPLKDW
jgi:TolB-like protein